MRHQTGMIGGWAAGAVCLLTAMAAAGAEPAASGLVPRFEMGRSGLDLSRHTETGTFFDVVGRRAAVFGYENRTLEAWAYPLKLVDDFKLSFRLEGYPLEIDGDEIATGISGFAVEEHVDGRPFHVRFQAPAGAAALAPLVRHVIDLEKPAYVTYELVVAAPAAEAGTNG